LRGVVVALRGPAPAIAHAPGARPARARNGNVR